MAKCKHDVVATVYDKRGKVLACCHNSYTKTHPIQAHYAKMAGGRFVEKIYLHAEIAAIIKAKGEGDAYKIKIERYSKDGSPRNAKPCPVCELAIKEAGISFVEYTC